MRGIAVNTRIQLLDMDRPREIFEAKLEETTPTRLALSVPHTIVRFNLCRQEGETAGSGPMGGSNYVCTPRAKT